MASAPVRRILLKLSGEALMGGGSHGIDPQILGRMAADVRDLVGAGIQVALVIGGGNIFRGAPLAAAGMNRVTGDHMGMLATVMNALAMGDTLERLGVPARVMSALPMGPVCEDYSAREAIRHLEQGRVTVNGEVETRRRKQLLIGDRVQLGDIVAEVTSGDSEAVCLLGGDDELLAFGKTFTDNS